MTNVHYPVCQKDVLWVLHLPKFLAMPNQIFLFLIEKKADIYPKLDFGKKASISEGMEMKNINSWRWGNKNSVAFDKQTYAVECK